MLSMPNFVDRNMRKGNFGSQKFKICVKDSIAKQVYLKVVREKKVEYPMSIRPKSENKKQRDLRSNSLSGCLIQGELQRTSSTHDLYRDVKILKTFRNYEVHSRFISEFDTFLNYIHTSKDDEDMFPNEGNFEQTSIHWSWWRSHETDIMYIFFLFST